MGSIGRLFLTVGLLTALSAVPVLEFEEPIFPPYDGRKFYVVAFSPEGQWWLEGDLDHACCWEYQLWLMAHPEDFTAELKRVSKR